MTRLAPPMTSRREHWLTPPDIWQRAVDAFGEIGLDPCSHPDATVPARERRYSEGLSTPWASHGLVWLNPPCGREIGHWTSRARSDGDHVIGLLPARTDTRWWHRDVVPSASRIVLVRGRITFGLPPSLGTCRHASPLPSALIYWGAQFDTFVHAYAALGWVTAGDGHWRRT